MTADNYQVYAGNPVCMVQMPTLQRFNETSAQFASRQTLQKAYKKAIQIYIGHTSLGAAADLAEAEAKLENAIERRMRHRQSFKRLETV